MDKDRLTRILVDACTNSEMINSGRHASAIIYKGQILAIGNNKRKSHPIMCSINKNTKRIFLHSEADAIIKVMNAHGMEIFPKTTLYVIRISKSGRLTLSKPCEICSGLIDAVGIKQVFWS